MKATLLTNKSLQRGSALSWLLVIILFISSIVGWYFYIQADVSLTKVNKQKQRIQQRYTQKSDQLYEAWNKLQKLNDNSFQLSNQLEQASSKSSKLNNQLEKLSTQNSQFNKQFDKLGSQNYQLNKQLEQVTAKNSQLHNQLDQSNTKIIKLKNQIDEIKIDTNSISNQLKLHQNNSDLLAQCKQQKANKISKLQQQVNKLSDHNKIMAANNKLLSVCKTDLAQFRLDYTNSQQLLDNKKLLINSLEKKLEIETTQLKSNIAELINDKNELNDEIKKLNFGNSYLESELKRMDKLNSQELKAFNMLEKKLKSEINTKNITIAHHKDQSSHIKVGNDLMFAPGQVHISKHGTAILDNIADLLKQFPNRKIEVIGHTDNIPVRLGSHKQILSNWELSAARSAAAIRYLQHNSKINPQRMLLVGASQYQPISDKNNDQSRAKNRRIEIKLLPGQSIKKQSP